jgi:hypothetical protein
LRLVNIDREASRHGLAYERLGQLIVGPFLGRIEMLEPVETHFAGHECVKLENESLILWVTQSVGPRIIGLELRGGENLFALLPDEALDCPGEGTFNMFGGHRLWHAPEDPQRTYIPDNEPVEVTTVPGGIRVIQPVEEKTGIRKSMTITLPDEGPQVIVDHSLKNLGRLPIELAPWAITQLKSGGVAILPQASAPVDKHGVLPNRRIVLWPYTHMNSSHINWGDWFIFVHANLQTGSLKLGFPNPVGWLGYVLGNTLFVKSAEYKPEASYFDQGSSSECYCNPRFLELETLGPRTLISPDEVVTHRETWALYEPIDFTLDQNAVRTLVESLEI